MYYNKILQSVKRYLIAITFEFSELKKDNTEMKGYIDKLVAKCMMHCPEALAQDDDEKTKLFVL